MNGSFYPNTNFLNDGFFIDLDYIFLLIYTINYHE